MLAIKTKHLNISGNTVRNNNIEFNLMTFLTSPSEFIRTQTMASLLGTHFEPFITRSLGGLWV